MELKVENAELKVALEAAKQKLDMMQQMAELREQNASLRYELNLNQPKNQAIFKTTRGAPLRLATHAKLNTDRPQDDHE